MKLPWLDPGDPFPDASEAWDGDQPAPGLLASAHVLAAQGGEGLLEVDANPNPLRTELAPVFSAPVEGRCRLGDAPGIGRIADVEALAKSLAR